MLTLTEVLGAIIVIPFRKKSGRIIHFMRNPEIKTCRFWCSYVYTPVDKGGDNYYSLAVMDRYPSNKHPSIKDPLVFYLVIEYSNLKCGVLLEISMSSHVTAFALP
jgi:hypothetical protein